MPIKVDRVFLEDLYFKYNHREFIHPDPLEFLYNYDTCIDKEVVGLIASSLAYGNVKQILKSVEKVLNPLGKNPAIRIHDLTQKEAVKLYRDFKHRFTTSEELIDFLLGMGRILKEYGSLRNFIKETYGKTEDLLKTQEIFVSKIIKGKNSLLPDVSRGSACKRLNLYFRWMVRYDEVDPGCWRGIIPASQLIIPLDTHMHAFALKFGFTRRKSNDIRTALEITEKFRKINPKDPVKYDFAITRAGIGGWYELP